MSLYINEPQNRISRNAIRVWLISETIQNLIGLVIIGGLFYLDYRFSWQEWIGWLLIILFILSILGTVWSFISPFIKYKSWRYEVDEDYVQIQQGVWKKRHLLIPMTKIQSVETVQGPLMKKYELYSVSMETMGSSHMIPVLPKEVALSLREQIAKFAKVKEEDE